MFSTVHRCIGPELDRMMEELRMTPQEWRQNYQIGGKGEESGG